MNYLYCHYIEGPGDDYARIGFPLYEASRRCDWKEAKAILYDYPHLVRYSITGNGETPLHIAASVKIRSKQVEQFVKNLLDMMSKDDLELQNQNHDTAFCQAAATRNIKTVMIMLEKNRNLATIAGGER
ncbi:putative ankyrin repeat-containing domain-containing protein [Helianthus annuus]|nr:putative ankyrin repeat-containing domain-containing protein [Helianthus annuus]KAJ0656262.1 putative ankyrin repeat-containing domain-containing protein [Helianthus annuus]